MQRPATKFASTTIWAVLLAVSIGFVAGRVWSPGETRATTSNGTPAAGATATREAELQEIERLQTQVAEQATACAPTATADATATPVPPKAQDVPLPYGENWTIAVTGIASATNIGDNNPEGIFMIVSMTVTNNEATERFFPYGDFILIDDQGRPFVEDVFLASRLPIEQTINFQFPPSLPSDTAIVFDVATDVGTSFILESTADPTFRVKVDVEMRG